jgi:outer membrane protein OmpA-like peptidoglycan-associated protein
MAACATPDRVVLLPQADGAPSAVAVRPRSGGEVLLSKPYETAEVTQSRAVTGVTSAEEVQARYKTLSDALPARPKSYLIYFETGGDQLTPESEASLEGILLSVKTFSAAELTVIGHTDTVGPDSVNDDISLKRAELIRQRLVQLGIDAKSLTAVGRGKREPLVPTADEVPEPRNRRVEIRVK